MEVSGQFHVTAALMPGRDLLMTVKIGGSMGPRAGLDCGEWHALLHWDSKSVSFGRRGKESEDTTRGWKLLDHLNDLSSFEGLRLVALVK
jgi:hypothetical protein